jgi:hypothetical protein
MSLEAIAVEPSVLSDPGRAAESGVGLRFSGSTPDCATVGRSAGCWRSEPRADGAGRTWGLLAAPIRDVAVVEFHPPAAWVADGDEVPVQPLQRPVERASR